MIPSELPTATLIDAVRLRWRERGGVYGLGAVPGATAADRAIQDASLAATLDTQPEAQITLFGRASAALADAAGAVWGLGERAQAAMLQTLADRARQAALAVAVTGRDVFATWWGTTPGAAVSNAVWVALGVGAVLFGGYVFLAMSAGGQAAIASVGQGYGAGLAGLGQGAGRALGAGAAAAG